METQSMGEPVGSEREIPTACCIVGGGPAGMMLGFLLARAGVDVTVLEKHADFLRDFRGDTIHPSTLRLMDELGLLDELLRLPHSQLVKLGAQIGETPIRFADFSFLGPRYGFIAFMPQWDFLNFLASKAAAYPNFRLIMQAEATDLIEDDGRIAGVKAMTRDGPLTVRATLTVGCDGRHSVVRRQAGFEVQDIGAPIDVFWLRLSRRPDEPQTSGRFNAGSFFAVIDRGDYYQIAYVIPKGASDAIRDGGIEAFRKIVADNLPFLADRVDELRNWDEVKLLSVRIDRLTTWFRPGLLCIGDAAHAMSPMGGVGINLAIQDAVAAANILWRPLADGTLKTYELAKVQRRRMFPTRVTQRLQVLAQNRIIQPVLGAAQPLSVPRMMRLIDRTPWLQRIPARIVGVGIRPEHIQSPARAVREGAARSQ
ncbi:2-polyprenyl-6-methoxyphenol hydroxylase [Hyphomicrobium sulfonivorans]|uniref:2-polyprenyl-6-methoxyphenol hydroxylase n=1 Tax=Hyphomicrobium sulfonivorans TaxID=121290 RepID=A0A120CWH2_HYPSL|nr:FAD-dependent oxidoreductase [Hyphomicrobium sulfonivorans]KWT69402.1 2-polyprenyl-6-methoxyphenol hydroxylase [Hyphomicrobium sulfonivorans]